MDTQRRKGLKEEILAEVQVPGRGGRTGRDGSVVSPVVLRHHKAPTAWA